MIRQMQPATYRNHVLRSSGIRLGQTLQVCDASGNCTIVPSGNFQAAALAVNAGTPIAQVASSYQGTSPAPPQGELPASIAASLALAPYLAANEAAVAAGPVMVTSAPASATTLPVPATTTSYAAGEIPGSFDYTADLEVAQNTLQAYGDTWDNSQTIVNALYAAGTAPGTVTAAMILGRMTDAGTAAAATTGAIALSDPSTWPWYLWAGAAGLAFVLLDGGNGKR